MSNYTIPDTIEEEYRDVFLITKGFVENIVEEEGYRTTAYDLDGVVHVGVGHNVSDRPIGGRTYGSVSAFNLAYPDGLPEPFIWETLKADIQVAADDAIEWIGEDVFADIPNGAKEVLVEMSFNMGGPRMRQFKKVRAAVVRGDFHTAAEEMLDSRWAKQLPARVNRMADKMKAFGYTA